MFFISLLDQLDEELIGQEHLYADVYNWFWNQPQSLESFLYLYGPSGCGKTFFLEKFKYPKFKFYYEYNFNSLEELVDSIVRDYNSYLYRKSIRPKSFSFTWPRVYVVEDVDLLIPKEREISEKEFLSLFSLPPGLRIVFTASYFKNSVMRFFKKFMYAVAFRPVMSFPSFNKLDRFLVENNGDVRNAKLQHWMSSKSPIYNHQKNIFSLISSLTSTLAFVTNSTPIEDVLEEDSRIVIQYCLHIFKQDPSVIHTFCATQVPDKRIKQYIQLRSMVSKFGKLAKEAPVHYDSEFTRLQDRNSVHSRRYGWTEYHSYIEKNEDESNAKIKKYLQETFINAKKK
jgi:hypothetical protein